MNKKLRRQNNFALGGRKRSARLVAMNERIGGVIVYGFEIFRLDRVGEHPWIHVQAPGDIAHQVLHELGVVIGALGDEFFIRAFDQTVDLARGLFFHDIDEVVYPAFTVDAGGQGDVRALIMRAVFRYLLGTGAETGDGDQDFDDYFSIVSLFFAY